MKYIKLFATGGTFDKEFNEINGDLEFQKTNLDFFRNTHYQYKKLNFA